MFSRTLSALYLLYFSLLITAQPAPLPFNNCSSNSIPNSLNQLAVSQVYAQITTHEPDGQRYLNVTVFGSSPGAITNSSDTSPPLLATMFTTTSLLTFNVFFSPSAFCDSARPPSPLPALGNAPNYCPISPGLIAFSTSAPINHPYELLSLNTRLRVVDASASPLELVCLDISAVPLRPGILGSVYGHAVIVFWSTVAVAIAYWLVVGIARIAGAWNRGAAAAPQKLWSRFQRAGFVLASAISGEKLATSPALLRFCTPSMRDIIFHTQWCAALGMVAVQWPSFVYPIFAQTAWATLTYNITLTQHSDSMDAHWDPLHVPSFTAPDGFSDQVTDSSSPLFINETASNTLFILPSGTQSGMEAFAYAVGIRPDDLFGICVGLFLIIVGGTIVLSLIVFALDWFLSTVNGVSQDRKYLKGSRSPRWSATPKDDVDELSPHVVAPEEHGLTEPNPHRSHSRPFDGGFNWWMRLGHNSFHWDVLWGNLIRILLLFHLPITAFSSFQFTRSQAEISLSSMVLAILSFAVFSIILPVCLIIKLARTSTNKLYDDTRTLLSLGPLYNQYASGSQTFAKVFFSSNLVFGVVLGCGQKSGTAQAIIILVAEVATALWTSVYLPWGRGAAMGVISFLFCVCRIISAVLLVILSPTVSVGDTAGGWIACAILLIQGLIYATFIAMLLIKILEGTLRLIFRVPFNRSKYAVDSGLLGVLSLSGLVGGHKKKTAKRRRYKLATTTRNGSLSSEDVLASPASHKLSSFVPSSRGPPSVLRADQVRTPYREDADDESGHILGNWPPFPDIVETVVQEPSKSGFTRVRGGRANFDTPYAIMSASPQAFPSTAEHAMEPSSSNMARSQPKHTASSLPPGAMAPGSVTKHVRKKSQTAILGDMSSLQSASSNQASISNNPVVLEAPRTKYLTADSGDEDETFIAGKRHWFARKSATPNDDAGKSGRWAFFKGRRRSEGDEYAIADREGEPENPVIGLGRSFVVIRDKRPSAPLPIAPVSQASKPSPSTLPKRRSLDATADFLPGGVAR